MPASVTPYLSTDLPWIVSLLQAALPAEPITEASFARKVLLDPNFDPTGALVARGEANAPIGFLLALVQRRPLEDRPIETDRGWITLFAVQEGRRREGIGSALLAAAEAWFRAQGRANVWISPYTPNYWTPGVDEAAYPAALACLHRRGYETITRPLSMAVSLVDGWHVPDWVQRRAQEMASAHRLEERVQIVPFTNVWITPLTDFLGRAFPGDWQRHLRETMLDIVARRRPCEELLLAISAGAHVLGFAQSEGERFGPFGVGATERGRGIGAVLLFCALEGMRARGHHLAWFLWTNDAAADRLYRAAGFRETRRYAILRKFLES